MPSTDTERPAPAVSGKRASKTDRLDGAINTSISDKPLVDKHGHAHSEAIFKNCSPAAIKALGIRRVQEGGAR